MDTLRIQYPELDAILSMAAGYAKIKNKQERMRLYDLLKFEIEKRKIVLSCKEYEKIMRLLAKTMRV